MKKSRLFGFFALVLVSFMIVNSASACTIFGVGKEATADGSTIVTHTCDSTSDDSRMWIIPRMKGGEGVKGDIVLNGNKYGDWSQYPEVKNYGGGSVIGEMDQPNDTYQYLHSNYSIINEHGLAMGESTFWIDSSTEYGKKIQSLIYDNNDGLMDCYQVQHIALERAKTAKEAVEIIGGLVEKYGWNTEGETINICDGNEVWIIEVYGRDLWAAVRIPENAFFVAANRARIDEFDFEDKDNYMCSANMKQFAIDNEIWKENSGEPFKPAEFFAPNDQTYSSRREWRAFDLVAPGLKLDSTATRYPLYVIPEKKLSVNDVMLLNSDYYAGTEYDLSKQPEAGPYGNVLNEFHKERPINLYRCTYQTIANVKGDLPDEAKCLVWFGYGAADTSYIVPLWASMTRLPALYSTGTRYTKFDRNSGWWINAYVQRTAESNYEKAVVDIHEARDSRLAQQYVVVNELQKVASELIKEGKNDEAVELLTSYAYGNAVEWHEYWRDLGDELYGKYMFGRINMERAPYPDWWKEILKNAPVRPDEDTNK